MNIVFLLLGLVLIIFGADWLVKGASDIAKKYCIPEIIIGLTIVAFGTSAPELIINIIASLRGSTELAIGNILGSNISNILLILGITALIYPISIPKSTKLKEIPFSLLAAVILYIMVNDDIFGTNKEFNNLNLIDGFILISLLFTFLIYSFFESKKCNNDTKIVKSNISLWKPSALFLIGLVALFFGGDFLVDGAVGIAQQMGVSERVIGLTIIAIGTSVPELATSIVAALKKQTDLAIGNIVGSNIFNIFLVLGVTSIITPIGFNSVLNFDILVTIIASIVLMLTTITIVKNKITKVEGLIFLMLYIIYIAIVIFNK